MNYLDLINLRQGTYSERDFSTGSTLPIVARPWGMHHWILQTQDSPWRYHPDHLKLQGLRLTHQPSPWMNDYGNLVVMPFTGTAVGTLEQQSSSYRTHALQPNYLHVELLRYRLRLEMSPSERGARLIVTRLGTEAIRIRFLFESTHAVETTQDPQCYLGVSRNHSGGVTEPFGLHFALQFDVAPTRYVSMSDGGVFEFSDSVERVNFDLAGSFISSDQARTTLNRELRSKGMETLIHEGATCWNELLGRIQLTPRDAEQERLFYSCLYRCLLFPRFLDEITDDGRTVHYSPYDGQVHPGSLCADSGFWDTYRTLYPLLAWVYPDKLRLILEGWLNACRESGWSPKWPSPGVRDCMIGTHYNVVVADAIANGITDWNIEEAFHYLWKDAMTPSADPCFGRIGLTEYQKLGYVPADRFLYATSATLDYAFDDFCIGRVARFLGKHPEAEAMERRASNYRNVFDPAVGFMRGRNADGSWRAPFSEFEWGGPFIEGGTWQHTFNVPHDPAGLAALLGGEVALTQKLDALLSAPRHFSSGSYPHEIHEMTEMAMAPFGQYAHSNQPVHHFLFLYAWAGQPEKTEHWVHRVANELYSVEKFPGDEDNGEMAAWYLYACLGRFPVCPGTSELARFTPLAPAAVINGVPL